MTGRTIKTTLKLTTGAIIVVAAYLAGAGIIPLPINDLYGDDTAFAAEPVRIPTVEARLIETHTVEYIEETVIEKEYIDVVERVGVELHNFTSLDELEDWVNDEYGRAAIRFKQAGSVIDCDDYALEMQRESLEDGYIMSFEIIDAAEYNGLFAIPFPDTGTLHAINLAIIGNSVFYIEPQTGEIVHAAYLD